ncbi:trichohyalin [Oryzias melastigma]|uniref:Trichohyalin-like n=1 Tax=Oryzias melastigma TaxID=30732 RepID=A0A3B3CFQ6_ORYME|nr:trichohyalin [Oryzias melastigma]XP_024130925.1 trichohyalin [Oryzias melastigma]
MAAQVEVQPGELGLSVAGAGLHLSPLSDSSNKSRIEVPSVDKSNVIASEPSKPVPIPKPRLTPKPFVVDRNPTIKPILAPKPQTKPRPESTRLAGHKPDLPSTPKPTAKPLSANSNRPAPTFYKTSNKLNLAQTAKPVTQPFKSAPPFDPDDPSKPTSSALAKKQKPVVSNFAYSKSLAVPSAAEWSGTTAKEKETNVKSKNKVGASITRAKSMGFLDEVGFDKEEKDEAKCEVPVPLRPKSSRPRPVSAIFPDSLNKTEKPVPAPRWAGRRPLSADLTSKFESIGLSLHRKSSDENTPAEKVPPQKTEDVPNPDLKSEKKTEESTVKEIEEEKQRPNIKSRISRLFDSSSLSVAGSTGQDPQSPVQPSPETETETSVGVKQLIKQLTVDPTPTQSPAVKPTPKPRPLSIDLTKRFSSEKSPDLNTVTEAADRHEISKVSQKGDEELANTPNDHKILYDLKESEEHLKDDSTSEGSSAKETSNTSQDGGRAGELHTVRAFLFDVERHNVTISEEEKPASLAKDLSRKPSFKRESVAGPLSPPVFEEPASPSTPLRVVHAFDTVQAIEEKRAVSESVPSAQWEDKAMTLRSRRSDTSRPGLEWMDQPQIQPPVEVMPVPRYLRVGALPKWNASDLNQESILEKGTQKESQREALVDKEGDRQRWADEEEGIAAHKYLKREKEEQPKPRATYFALTGQMQEPVSPRDAGTREITVPSDNSSVRSALGGPQGKVLSVKRNPSLEEAFERNTSLQELEAMMRRQLSPNDTTSHTDKQSRNAEKENRETERENLHEQVREQVKETQRQLEEEKKRSLERIIEVDRQELIEVKKPRLKEKERQRFHEIERQKHKENIEEAEKLKQMTLEQEMLKEREKQKEIERERQKQMQQELERQRELSKEKMRKRDEERQRELDKERQQLEMQQEKQRMEEMEKQKELERQQLELQREKEKQWLAEEAEKIKLIALEQERMRLKELEKERARQRELEHQREVEREKQKEMQKRRWQEIERLRQREEKERQWQLEREKQELERQREIEREKLQEQERAKERQRDEERQKQLDRERLQLEMQQEKHRKEEEKRELERQQLEVQKQRQKELERQQLAEEAEKLRQAALEQERLKLKELEKEREKQREIELRKEMERERQRQLEMQRQLDLDKQEFENQKLRKQELKEKMEKEEAEKLRQVAKQQEAERQRLREKQWKDEERLKLESSAMRPTVLDLDSVLRDELSPKASPNHGDPSMRWREPYKPAILDIDSFKPEAQPSPNKDLFPVSAIQELDAAFGFKSSPAPERDTNWKVPPQPTAVWTMSPQDPWELQPVEMSVDKPVIEPKKSPSTLSPQQPLRKQEERLPDQQNDWAAFLNERFHTSPEVRTRNSLGVFSGSPQGEEIWVPRESQSRSPRRLQGSQELNRMRSRSMSRKSARSNSSMEENLSRMRSRSANREQDRHSWVQQTQSGEEEKKHSGTPVRETDSQYGTWETGLRSDDSLTSVTPSSDSFLSPSPRKPSPPTSPGDNALLSDKDTLDSLPPSSSSESQPLSFPDAPTTLLDTSALRSRAQLGKKRAPRSRPTRAARQSAAQSEESTATTDDWLYRDSTEAKPEIQETELESEEPTRGADVGLAVPSQPQRVAMFPGLDPSALKAQLKRRSDSDNQPDPPAPSPSQPSRSPKSPFLPRATRVLPPPGGKENGEEESPKWLKELKSKKRFSQYENENN